MTTWPRTVQCPSCWYELPEATPGRRCPECGSVFDPDYVRPPAPAWRVRCRRVVLACNAVLALALPVSGVIYFGVGGPSLPWLLSSSLGVLAFPVTTAAVRILAGTLEYRLCAVLFLATFAPGVAALCTGAFIHYFM